MKRSLRDALNDALRVVELAADHELPIPLRRLIYAELGALTTTEGYLSQLHAAVAAARRTLPIFNAATRGDTHGDEQESAVRLPKRDPQATWPYRTIVRAVDDEAVPPALLSIAAGILDGTIMIKNPVAFAALSGRIAQGLGSDDEVRAWEYFDYGTYALNQLALAKYPNNARCAARACYKSLAVAFGFEQLASYEKCVNIRPDGSRIRGTDLSDRDLSATPAADVASCAVVAFSWRGRDAALASDEVETFWKWWLGEAIPAAYAFAHSHP